MSGYRMSNKRFVLKNAYPFDRGEYIFDSNQNKFIIEMDEIIELLNSLSKENKQLERELDSFNPVVFQDMRKGTVILYDKSNIDLCSNCIYFLKSDSEISSEGYFRITKCSKKGKVKGVLSECEDYESM